MSNMTLFNPNQDATSQLPAHLQGLGLGIGQALMAAIGDSYNRIGMKGSRFRQVINGQEVGVWDENYLDVIIVGVVPTVSRIFYAGAFKQGGDNAPPTCFSVDNVAPPLDLASRQSNACATCPQNIKGSKVSDDGHEGKACGFFRRIVVMLPGDTTLYRIDVKAQGLFGESHDKLNKFSMNDYAKFLAARGVDASVLVTRLSFDTDVSVPKLLFSPSRYVTPEEIADVQEIGAQPGLKAYLEINFKTIDISKEGSPAEEAADVPAAEPPRAAPKPAVQAAPKPVAQAAPRPVVQAAPKPVAQAAPRPVVQAAPKPVAQAVKPKPAAGRLVQAAPAVQIDDAVSIPQEVGSEEDLRAIMDDLGL